MSESERRGDYPRRAAEPVRSPAASSGLRVVGRALSVLALVAVAVAATVLLVAGIVLAVAYPNLPEIGGLTDYRPKLPLRIYSADGTMIGEFGEERRNNRTIEPSSLRRVQTIEPFRHQRG